MAIRYANSAGLNVPPYDTFANGATDPQTIVDLAVAGDINYYGGYFTLTADVDIDTNAGTLASGFITHKGVNPTTGLVDGSKPVFDGNSSVTNCINLNKQYHDLAYFELKNANGRGLRDSNGYDKKLSHIVSHNNGTDGFALNYSGGYIECCIAYDNGGSGFGGVWDQQLVFCKAYDNGTYGFNMERSSTAYRCLSYDNSTAQARLSLFCHILGGVYDGKNDGNYGVDVINKNSKIQFARISNNTIGIRLSSGDSAYWDYNVLELNTSGEDVDANAKLLGGDNNISSLVDSYIDRSAGNFNLIPTALGVDIQIDLDDTNKTYETAGLIPAPAAGGVSKPRIRRFGV